MHSVLYNDSYNIGIEELNKIYISLLTIADKVYINGNVEIDWQVSPDVHRHIKGNLDKLQKEGLIVYWRYPNEKQKTDGEIILDNQKYMFWDGIINKTFFDSKNLNSIFNYLGNKSKDFSIREENTSKILLIRREWWAYALLNILETNKVMNFFSGWMPNYENMILSPSALIREEVRDIAVTNIFADISSSVFALQADEVISLRKKNKTYRNSLNEKIEQCQPNNIIPTLLNEAIEANKEIMRDKKFTLIDNSFDFSVALAGVVTGTTPTGFVLSQISTAKSLGQGLHSALGTLLGMDKEKNMFYLLLKMKKNINKSFTLKSYRNSISELYND